MLPAIATVVEGSFVFNDFSIPFRYLPSDDFGTVSTALFRFKSSFGAHSEDRFSGAALVVIPTPVIFRK